MKKIFHEVKISHKAFPKDMSKDYKLNESCETIIKYEYYHSIDHLFPGRNILSASIIM